ncbi:Methionine synthase [compost metagenome]
MNIALRVARMPGKFARRSLQKFTAQALGEMHAAAADIGTGFGPEFQRFLVVAELDADLFEDRVGITLDQFQPLFVEDFVNADPAGDIGQGCAGAAAGAGRAPAGCSPLAPTAPSRTATRVRLLADIVHDLPRLDLTWSFDGHARPPHGDAPAFMRHALVRDRHSIMRRRVSLSDVRRRLRKKTRNKIRLDIVAGIVTIWAIRNIAPNQGREFMSDDDIILSELSDEELVQQMHDDLYDGLREEIEEATNILLERGWTPYDVLTEALVEGMRIVGIDFRDGILFVPEVLLSANAMKAGMAILRPLLAETGAPKLGKVVIGTVKGDIHDIGKNLVGMMMEGAGFDVVDLGINNPVENYLDAIEREKPDILGMSALLTTTMPYMKVVIDTMKEKGIRDDYVVLVGGAPLNEEFGKAVGADAYCRDAAVAVETAKDFLSRRHNRMAAGA